MITVFCPDGAGMKKQTLDPGDPIPETATWIDLNAPGPQERRQVEEHLGILLPSTETTSEIEHSSRYYQRSGVTFTTLPILWRVDTPHPELTNLTLIRLPTCLLTLHYGAPQALISFQHAVARNKDAARSADSVAMGLLEMIIDRLADIVERIGRDLTQISQAVFRPEPNKPRRQRRRHEIDLEEIIRQLGRLDDLLSMSQQQVAGLQRAMAFWDLILRDEKKRSEIRTRIRTQARDLASIGEYTASLSSKASFLLDATLGLINLGQTRIVNMLSIVATIFLPPTLIASAYGMNFQFMPELNSPWGYPIALLAMLASALLPLWIMRRNGWM